MGPSKVIEARELSKNVQGGISIRRVRFTVSRGEVVGVIGPRRAGKSTLLKMLAGFVTPSSGEGVVAGLSTLLDPFRIKHRAGYAAGDCSLPPRSTPRELLEQRGKLHGLPPLELEARIEAVVSAFELERFIGQPAATLRPDQQQRLNLARAMLHDPPALILDEPTHALDVMGHHFVRMAIRAARDAGKAVLLATRSPSDAESLCDRVLLMHKGQLVGQGTIAEVRSQMGARTFTEAVMRLFPLRTA